MMFTKLNTMDILVVDHDRASRALLRAMLFTLGYQNLRLAERGRQAMEHCREKWPDCILMDLLLPDMDGWMVTKALRDDERPSGRRGYIVAVTGYVAKGLRQTCLDHGMDEYLPKPFRLAELEEVLLSASGSLEV